MSMKSSFSLITYNIHKGFSVGKLKFLLPQMRQALIDLHPDFVFLQEVQGEHKKKEKRIANWPDSSQFEFIAEKMWPHFAYGRNAVYQSGHHGNAILSQYTIEEYDNINLSMINRASRSILHARIVIDGTTVHLLCVHLGLFKQERSFQCDTLVERIRQAVPSNEPLLMAGDFNDWRKELSTQLETNLGLQEAYKELKGDYAKTYPALRPALRNDRIYYRGLKLIDVSCLSAKPWRLLSDHLPLFAEFELV